MNANECPLACTQPSVRPGQIVAAARRLFVRHGYRRTSMDDIAQEAGLAKATLYLHFQGKEGIFRAMLGECRAQIELRAQAAESLAGPLKGRLAALLFAYLGTALEWFGDESHLRELHTVIGQNPDTFGPDNGGVKLEQRLLAQMLAAQAVGGVSPGTPEAELDQAARLLRNAAVGAKSCGGLPALDAYRERLDEIATFVAQALAPRRG